MKKILPIILVSLLLSCLVADVAFGDELSDLEEEFKKTKERIEQTGKEKSKKESELSSEREKEQKFIGSLNELQNNLSYSQNQLSDTLVVISQKEAEISATVNFLQIKEGELAHQQELLAAQVRNLYINSFYDPITYFFQDEDALSNTQLLVFHEAIIGSFKEKIAELNERIRELENKRLGYEAQKERLVAQKLQLERKKESLEQNIVATKKEISAAQTQQQLLQQTLAGIEHQLAELTTRQKEILAKKAAAALATTTVGNIEITRKAIEKDPPKDGKLYFSFWTYGYPHRVGMNQYGAYGRSKAGQTFEQILHAYYAGVEISAYPVPATIKINRNGSVEEVSFEDDYLMGIGEMPSCWGKPEKGGMEALKAQAIAARTYALNYTGNGVSPICIDQRCQVYVGQSKVSGECGQYWKKAVTETRGKVITYNGEPISAWYASTAGGFTLSSQEVWGSPRPYALGIVDFADPNNLASAFDGPQYGNSPWYHKSWGSEPWLSVERTEDLLNAALLPEKYNEGLHGKEEGGISAEEILVILRSNGIGPITGLTSIEHFGSAAKATTKLRAYHNGTYTEIDAARFRFVFNLRSPATNAIWTSRFDIVTSQ